MLKWEKELNLQLTLQQWHSALYSIYRYSKCTNHWETTVKIVNRWYYTPYRLAKMSLSIPSICWRECGRTGTLLHILWECPSLTSFWNTVFQCISSCTGILTPPNPELAILHINIDKFPYSQRQVITHLLLAARTLILRNWRSTTTPNLSEAISLVNDNYLIEKSLAVNSLSYRKFQESWKCWPYLTQANRLS